MTERCSATVALFTATAKLLVIVAAFPCNIWSVWLVYINNRYTASKYLLPTHTVWLLVHTLVYDYCFACLAVEDWQFRWTGGSSQARARRSTQLRRRNGSGIVLYTTTVSWFIGWIYHLISDILVLELFLVSVLVSFFNKRYYTIYFFL